MTKSQKIKIFQRLLGGKTIKISEFELKIYKNKLCCKHHPDLEWVRFGVTFDSFLELISKNKYKD